MPLPSNERHNCPFVATFISQSYVRVLGIGSQIPLQRNPINLLKPINFLFTNQKGWDLPPQWPPMSHCNPKSTKGHSIEGWWFHPPLAYWAPTITKKGVGHSRTGFMKLPARIHEIANLGLTEVPLSQYWHSHWWDAHVGLTPPLGAKKIRYPKIATSSSSICEFGVLINFGVVSKTIPVSHSLRASQASTWASSTITLQH